MDMQQIITLLLVAAAFVSLARHLYGNWKGDAGDCGGCGGACGKPSAASHPTKHTKRAAPEAKPLVTLSVRPARRPAAPSGQQEKLS